MWQASFFVHAADDIALKISSERTNDAAVVAVDYGEYAIKSTGSDPYLYTEIIEADADWNTNHVLAFEYFSLTGTGGVQVFLVPPVTEDVSVHGEALQRSEVWSKFSVDLSPALALTDRPITALRIDFGNRPGKTVKLRNIVLRAKSDEERAYEARKAEQKATAAEADQALREYLDADFPAALTRVHVDDESIRIEGNVGNEKGDLQIAEVPVYADISKPITFSRRQPIRPDADGSFSISASRIHTDGHDAIFSRWMVVRDLNPGLEVLSHARYADTIEAKNDLPEEFPRNRKGLGGLNRGRPIEDLEDLGVAAVTVNILLDWFMRMSHGDGRSAYEYGGRTWYIDEAAVARMDWSMLEAAKHDLIVSAIILLNQPRGADGIDFRRAVAHPDAHPDGIFVMPNLTSAEGLQAYSAAMNFLAERYSRPDKNFGRIHHWIMHNEVNSGWVWTNMGETTALRYMDAYHKSMRVAHIIARQHNPHARVYISLEHNWTSIHNPKCHTGRELLELLIKFSHAEGDFEWGLAYHPYPESLGNPRTWEDKTAIQSFDTPRITFKNIEVIDAWMKRPEALFLGEHVRDIQFTEQGPNSPDYSEKSLLDQAAAMAYVWQKMNALDSVSMFHFHNWVDNRGEGGLKIGLRKYPDDADDPHGKKPVWYVFQALDTPGEEEATDFAKKIVGINNWNEITTQKPKQ